MAINRLNPDYPDAGLVQVVVSSVAVGSGSGSVDGNGSVTFSGASSVSLNGVFNSTYDNYRIIFAGATSNTSIINIHGRLRVSGTDASGSNYNWISLEMTGAAGPTRYSGGSHTQGYVANGGNGYFSSSIDIFRPFIASTTMWTALSAEDSNSDQNLNLWKTYHTLTTSYDGITVYPASGTITGTIQVYGYRK